MYLHSIPLLDTETEHIVEVHSQGKHREIPISQIVNADGHLTRYVKLRRECWERFSRNRW